MDLFCSSCLRPGISTTSTLDIVNETATVSSDDTAAIVEADYAQQVSPSGATRSQDLCNANLVNGKDLSKSSHEEAVEAFRTAPEPIVVEVLRRVSKTPPGGSTKMKTRSPPPLPSPDMVTVATQTDDYIESSYFDLFQSPGSPTGFCPIGNLVQPASRHGMAFSPTAELGLTDLEMSNGLEYDDEFDPERAFDMEYEEVTLHRQHSEEKVGLTLCYGSADDEITDIFVGEIEPYSIAAEDGRIREGDQILQINGEDVHTREEAIKLFTENRSDITLLLSRQIVQMDDGFMDERNGLDDLEALDQQHHHHHKLELTAAMLGQGRHHDEEGGTTDTATTENSQKHEKDSGVGRTDGDSTRNDESSEQEMMENDCISPGNNAKYSNGLVGSADHHYSNDSFTSNETGSHDQEFGANDIPAEECQKFREVLETRCSSGSEGSPAKSALLPRKDSQSSIEREIAALNKEMEQIQMQCQEIVETHTREQHRVNKEVLRGEPGFRSPRMVPRMGTRLDYIKQLQGVTASAQEAGAAQDLPIWVRHEQLARVANQVHREAMAAACASDHNRNTKYIHSQNTEDCGRDTSNTSAYNTGESSRSTPLTLELHQACDNDNLNGKGHKNSMLSLSMATSSTGNKPSHSDSEKLQTGQGSDRSSGVKKEWCSDGDAKGLVSKSQSSTSVSRMSQTGDLEAPPANETLQELYAQYADVMYTNRANLQHTIMVQQKLFQQQLMQRARSRHGSSTSSVHMAGPAPKPTPTSPARNGHASSTSSPAKSRTSKSAQDASPSHSKSSSSKSPSKTAEHHSSPVSTPSHQPCSPSHTDTALQGGGSGSGKNEDSNEMEWVVKRRADGSRYITRRPIRNKLLKERAKKLNEERCGMTTDDDAVSELKVGRYWNKEERKRHLEKSRDRKMKKEAMMRQRMETVKEQEESGRKEPNIVELSHRKMMKHKGKKVLDDFTTLHEMLAHGTRDQQSKVAYNPLLSVTTV